MKKIVLLVAFALLGVSTTQAKNMWNGNQSFSFIQNGIQFTVFPNGEFNFNAAAQPSSNGYYNDANYNNDYASGNYNIYVDRDQFGRIRKVDNVFIDYDNLNRVYHIGNIVVDYNRFAPANVGNIQIVYNGGGPYISGSAVINVNRCNNYPSNGYGYCRNNFKHGYPNKHGSNHFYYGRR